MKYLTLLMTFILLLASCEDACDIQADIDELSIARTRYTEEVKQLRASINEKSAEVLVLEDKLKALGIYQSGSVPHYIIKVKLKQSHFSLDPTDHIKDAANAVEFELPVSEEFYNSVEKGTQLMNEFRSGSFIMKGSLGSWEMTVVNKYIQS